MPWRCGGAVVLAVITDREGRWWQVMECCSRCAAAHPTAKVVATAPAAEASARSDGFRADAAVPTTRGGTATPGGPAATTPTFSAAGPHFSHSATATAAGTAVPQQSSAPRSDSPVRPPPPP
ncbi:hypothetical protein GA0115255_110802, partial [Streptomyces sp. Ncost-T6T-2b]